MYLIRSGSNAILDWTTHLLRIPHYQPRTHNVRLPIPIHPLQVPWIVLLLVPNPQSSVAAASQPASQPAQCQITVLYQSVHPFIHYHSTPPSAGYLLCLSASP